MRAISAISGRSKRTAVLVFAVLIGLALVGWAAARQIRSPAQIAADTAPPKPSAITVPVVRRTLSTEVIVRGTVRYGDPQAVVLGVSKLKQASGTNSSDIVTRPPRRGLRLAAGHVAMTVDGRPVFVLPGAIPMHRDLRPGDHGQDVRQLERALKNLGFNPGAVDGHYDSATAGAVSAFYLHPGWDPFGATDTQPDQLRTAPASDQIAAGAALRQAQDAVKRTQAELNASITTAQSVRADAKAAVAKARSDAAQAQRDVHAAAVELRRARLGVSTARQQARITRQKVLVLTSR